MVLSPFRKGASSILSLGLRAFDPLLSLFFPSDCKICGGAIQRLDSGPCCESCWTATQFFDIDSPCCTKCGNPAQGRSKQVSTCFECSNHHFDKALALGPYEKALKATVVDLKTNERLPRCLLSRFPSALQNIDPPGSIDLIIPIPLSKLRYLERGFNQAEVIAEPLSRLLRVPFDRSSLERVKHTPMHRAGMDRIARAKTVEKAFDVARPTMITGRHILLVDDVMTSGSTASACAEALKKSGAASVTVFTLARAPRR